MRRAAVSCEGAGTDAEADRRLRVPGRGDAGRLRGSRVGVAPLLPEREQAERRARRGSGRVWGAAAGGWLRGLDGPGVWHGGRGVPRVHREPRRAGRSGRRSDRRVRRDQPKTVEHKLCAVRSLLRFAAAGGLIDRGVLETVPPVRSVRQARVPSVWDPADVAKIIEAIDRGNPSGKRDYAIVLLICRLGLRAVDVKRLEFADLDWPGNRASVVQAKTGQRVQLPLLKDVGWAIIDYIRDGRPASD